MGEVHLGVRLSNAGDVERVHRGMATMDQVRSCEVDALVDTGSTRSVIPAEIVGSLGLTLVDTAVGRLGDGSSVSVGICSAVGFEIMGRRTFEEAYVMGKEILISVQAPHLELRGDIRVGRSIERLGDPRGVAREFV